LTLVNGGKVTGDRTMKMLELKNTFHNTTVKIRIDRCPGWISKRSRQRAKRKLCGIKGCICSNEFGERPSVHQITGDDGVGVMEWIDFV